ncbi:MAG: DEAD/DEAH box helicase family protein [Vampirovibrionales bacterium]
MFKFKFHPHLPHQQQAVDATLALFEKLDAPRFMPYEGDFPQLQGANIQHLPLSIPELNQRLQHIQTQAGIEAHYLTADSPLRFSIEMETGTGKTYVYLKSIVELYKRYGWHKFIILVPTNAIRAGVLQSLKHLTPHFAEASGVTIHYEEFKGGQVHTIQNFCMPDDRLQVLVMSTGALNRPATNVLYQDIHSGFHPHRPIDYLKAVRPIVMIDEPQKAQTTSNTIQQLYKEVAPLWMLDYSATHKESFPLLYRLDPFTAMEQRLVKSLRIRTLDTTCLGDLQLLSLGHEQQKPCATFQIKKVTQDKVEPLSITLQKGGSLYEQSNKHTSYQALGRIERINLNEGYVEFENQERLYHQNLTLSEPALREMMAQTIQAHFEKQQKYQHEGIKVLSLFFVGSVSDYRIYKEGKAEKGDLARWFEEEYTRLAPRYAQTLTMPSADKVHAGSFAQDSKGQFIDVEGLSSEAKKKAEASAYELIMNNKEELLNPDTDLRFIFAHSRLREGWDCPNIFQICTLKQDADKITKRQEIGRGMRLAVNTKGERLSGDHPINSLLLITTTSYEQYLKELKADYIASGYTLTSASSSQWAKYLPSSQASFTPDKKDLVSNLTHQCLVKANILVQSDKKDQLTWNIEEYEDKQALQTKLVEVFQPMLHFVPELEPYLEGYVENITQPIKGLKSFASHDNKAYPIQKNQDFLGSDLFKTLWSRISKKAIYRFDFSEAQKEETLIETMKTAKPLTEALRGFNHTIHIQETCIEAQDIKEGQLQLPHFKLTTLQAETTLLNVHKPLQKDWLVQLARKLKIKKSFLCKIIQDLHYHYKREGYALYAYILFAPEEAQIKLKQAFEDALQSLHFSGIRYEETSLFYDASILFTIPETLNPPYSKNLKFLEKTLYIPTKLDSLEEVKEQEALDTNHEVLLYVKLPKRFKVTTPTGTYNPDWAIIKRGTHEEKLFLIKETKGQREDNITPQEQLKITCGRTLFAKYGVAFKT